MLYLNPCTLLGISYPLTDLTLTSVVFEFPYNQAIKIFEWNLTLTSVVFELM